MAEGTTGTRPQQVENIFQTARSKLLACYASIGPLSPAISDFTFDSAGRLYYFGTEFKQTTESILMLDLKLDAELENTAAVQAVDPNCAHSADRNWTVEQEMIFERKRVSPKPAGIDSFEIETVSGRFLMTAGTNLLLGTPSEDGSNISCQNLSLRKAVNAKLCPGHPEMLAFVRESNLHLYHVPSGQEFGVSDIPLDEVSAGVSAGVASFLVQEDMDRYEGFWWKPVSFPKSDSFCLLYEVVNDFEIKNIPLHHPLQGSVTQQKYPVPQGPISKSDLVIAEFSLSEKSPEVYGVQLRRRRLSVPLWELLTGADYLLRVGWATSGDSVWIQILNRSQQQLRLIEIPISCFRTAEEWETSPAESLPPLRLLVLERSEFWINSHNLFSIIPNKDKLEFVIASSTTNFQHLYHITAPTVPPSEATKLPGGDYSLLDLSPLCEVTQLTDGEWGVDKESVWVDRANKLLYYLANSATPVEHHLHVSSYASKQPHKVLTQPGHFIECSMDSECKYAVLTYSSLSSCPEIRLCKINSSPHVPEIELQTLKILHKSAAYPSSFTVPQIHKFKNLQGVELYSLYSQPKSSDPDKKHPLLVYVYGGPMIQLVKNEFAAALIRIQIFCQQGFSVLITDNMGTAGRGLQFEGAVKHRLGQIEISDQVEAIQYVDKNIGGIDMAKIAIHGWSYGGYLSFLALAQRPDIFRVAVCGGTVQDWRIYESAYTEKYMGTPETNPDGYNKGCGEFYVSGLPQETGRLLFIHGEIDENVHFTHVQKLISSIISVGAPYMLNVFPDERHGIRNGRSRIQMNTTMISFIKESLKASS